MATKAKGNRWGPGVSGNPRGRPRGSGSIGALRKAIECRMPGIIERLIALAEGGDIGAAKVLVDRCLPALRPVDQAVALALPADGGLTAQGQAVVVAVSDGRISPSQAAGLLAGLAGLARIKELDEIETRLRRLEGETDAGES